ncbi:MAG: YIP1 family protein [Promethearchaeota archaeon]
MDPSQTEINLSEKNVDSTGKDKVVNFFKDYFNMIRSPNKMIDKLNSGEPNLLKALLVVLLSSVIFVSGIFLYGDPILTLYDFYSTNFLIEQWTSLTSLGYFTYTTHSALLFLHHILFWLKIWIVMGLIVFLWCKLFQIEVKLERTLEMTAYAMYPWLIITFPFFLITLALSFIIPAYAYAIMFPVVLGILVVITPCLFSTFIYKKANISSFKATFPYLFSLLTLYAIWLYSNTELWFHFLVL